MDRTVKLHADGRPQVFHILATSLTRGGVGNLTATFTATKEHRLTTGDKLKVKGADLVEYNGTFPVTVTSPTAFTYTMEADPGDDADETDVVGQKILVSTQYDPFVGVHPDSAGKAVEIVGVSRGMFGGEFIVAADGAQTGNWGIIESFDDATQFTTLTGTISGVGTNTLPKGMRLYGIFTAITLAAGRVVAYNDREP
jgi:hypothetical protein